MLVRLSIQNLAIIDRLVLDFSPGLSVLTGETGAGKSIIVGALNLVLGERASAEDVRTGCPSAIVEALFEIEGGAGRAVAALAEFEGADEAVRANRPARSEPRQLVLRREVSAEGRSRCQINGRLVTLAQLRRLGDALVDLHGQHRHQSLLRADLHGVILDEFDPAIAPLLEAWRALYGRHGEVLARLKSLNRDEREIARQKDMLEFQRNEIAQARLEPGEDQALEEERRRLEHAETLARNALGANDLLLEGAAQTPTARDLLAQAADLVEQAARLDPSLEELGRRLAAARIEIEDVAGTLRDYADGLASDPRRLADVDERLQTIRRLKRKYGESIEEILAAAQRYETELKALTHSREEREALEAERANLERKLARAAEALSARRAAAAERFAKGLRRHLADLDMPKVRFVAQLERQEVGGEAGAASRSGAAGSEAAGATANEPPDDDLQPDDRPQPASGEGRVLTLPDGRRLRIHDRGADYVEFLISPNPGEDLKPLRRIASGGELSRVMLALKALMTGQEQVPTLVFDEIDTGISGRTGARVGEKMAALAEGRQVLCITHLPQIAARARHHYAVRKISDGGRSVTRVEALGAEQRLGEIARLLGGQEDSPTARKHARELLAACAGTQR